jgi:hypothetical protein
MSHASLAAPFAEASIKNSSVTLAHLSRRLVTSKVEISRPSLCSLKFERGRSVGKCHFQFADALITLYPEL